VSWRRGVDERQDMVEGLLKHLENRDMDCPACGYNLRGLAGESCPECGKQVLDELARVSEEESDLGVALAGTGVMIIAWFGVIAWCTFRVDPLSIIALWVPLSAICVVLLTLVVLPKRLRVRSRVARWIATGLIGTVGLGLLGLLVLMLIASL
jgi:hypothetical protein